MQLEEAACDELFCRSVANLHVKCSVDFRERSKRRLNFDISALSFVFIRTLDSLPLSFHLAKAEPNEPVPTALSLRYDLSELILPETSLFEAEKKQELSFLCFKMQICKTLDISCLSLVINVKLT